MATIAKLPIGHTETLTATYTVQESDMGREDMTCTATARSKRTEVEGTSAAITMEAVRRALKLTKTVANTPADGEAYAPGEDVEFDIKTENTGNQTLSGVEVTEQTDGVSIVEGDGYTLDDGAAKIATLAPKQFVTVDSVKHVSDNDWELESWTNTAQGKIGEIIQSGVSPVVYFAKPIPQDFNGLSWDSDIPEVAEDAAKKRNKYLHLVGKEKTFTTTDMGTFTARCLDVAHFEKYDVSSMAGLTFGFKEAPASNYPMGVSGSRGSYIEMTMYKTTMTTILEHMQSELREHIAEVKFLYNVYKGEGQGDESYNIFESHAKLFPPSNRELWGVSPVDVTGKFIVDFWAHTGADGTQLEYWKNHTSLDDYRTVYKVGTAQKAYLWTRSCCSTAEFIYLYDNGGVGYDGPGTSYVSVAPLFNI